MNNTKYFLYVGQTADLETRSMLIPINLLSDNRKLELNEIKKLPSYDCGLPNVYVLNYNFANCYYNVSDRDKYIVPIIEMFNLYSQPKQQMYYIVGEEEWLNNAIYNLCSGFNHIENYKRLLNKYKNVISDSILVLESLNGSLNLPYSSKYRNQMDDLCLQFCSADMKCEDDD